MKNIVQEVLKPGTITKQNPLLGTDQSKYLYSKSIVTGQDKSVRQNSVQGLYRPNYQQKNMDKRLAGMTVQSMTNDKSPASKTNQERISSSSQHIQNKDPILKSLSQLHTLSLVQGNRSEHHSTTNKHSHNHHEESQFLGQTRNGIKAWIFSGLHSKLQESFKRSLKSHHIGVILAEQTSIGQLFIINEVLREYGSMKYSLTWEVDNGQGFVLELYQEDFNQLKKASHSLIEKLSQYEMNKVQTFKVQSPSPWLSKQLKLMSHVDGAAVIEGINHYTAIYLLDRYLKRKPQHQFSYKIEKSFLLIYGDFEIICQVADDLLQETERIK